MTLYGRIKFVQTFGLRIVLGIVRDASTGCLSLSRSRLSPYQYHQRAKIKPIIRPAEWPFD